MLRAARSSIYLSICSHFSGRSVKQLAVIPPEYEHQQYCDDSPAEAQLDAHQVQPDDLLLLASDGLWSGAHGGTA